MRLSSDSGTWLQMLALFTYVTVTGICSSIRYGFLADSFSNKGVNGKLFGAVETSLFIGYFLTYMTQFVEALMKRFTSKHILAVNAICMSIVAGITGLSYQIKDVNTFIAISFVMRILHGSLVYFASIVPIDYLNAYFAKDFELTNALLQAGYITGQGVSESLGSVLYDHFGYCMAYGFAACLAMMGLLLIWIVLPNNKTHLATQTSTEKEITEADERSCKSQALSKFLIPIMVAAILCSANYGVIQVFFN